MQLVVLAAMLAWWMVAGGAAGAVPPTPTCTTVLYCGGAAYLTYKAHRNMLFSEWPNTPADPSCYRDTKMLEVANWTGGPLAAAILNGSHAIYKMSFNLPQVDVRQGVVQTIWAYKAHVYAPVVHPSATSGITVTIRWPQSTIVVGARSRTWAEECRPYCREYILADVTATVASMWKNRPLAVNVSLVIPCGSTACQSMVIGHQDVPILLFDYVICGDTATQAFYYGSLLTPPS